MPDNINLTHFVNNLLNFQQETNAKITIVSYNVKSFRTLRKGLPYDVFNKELEQLLNHESRNCDSQPQSTATPVTPKKKREGHKCNLLDDTPSIVVVSTPTSHGRNLPDNTPSTPTISHRCIQLDDTLTTATPVSSPYNLVSSQSESEQVSVVPGAFTYSEALKQSSGSGEVFSLGINNNAQALASDLNSLARGAQPIT